jgi:hypothetical protein
MFAPGRSDAPIGSQQIVDRYPDHFASANALEQRRSRLRKKGATLETHDDRLVDYLIDRGDTQ